MNQKQKEELLNIVSEDCKINGLYINEEGDTCAVGAIALAAGVDKELLVMAANRPIVSCQSPVHEIRQAIFHRFGLDFFGQWGVQSENDRSRDPDERRRRVAAYINSLAVSEDESD